MAGWNMPPGCTTLPGESKADLAHEAWIDQLGEGDYALFGGHRHVVESVDYTDNTVTFQDGWIAPLDQIERTEDD